MSRSQLVVIGHDASRSGAPILLLRFLEWISANEPALGIHSILLAGGPLLPAFGELGPTTVLDRHPIRGIRSADERTERPTPARSLLGAAIRRAVGSTDDRVVYGNSFRSGAIVDVLRPTARRALVHVHELDYAQQTLIRPSVRARAVRSADHWIACSDAVRRSLIEGNGIESDAITVAYGVVAPGDEPRRARDEMRKSLGLGPDDVLIGGSGSLSWQKGPDLFAQVARLVSRSHPRARFAWVGGRETDPDALRFRHEIRHLEVDAIIDQRPHVDDPGGLFAAMDLFLMTSREDSFPLVCLEVAQHGVPVLCFDNAGGSPEFVEHDDRLVAPYADAGAMAERVGRLVADPELRSGLGSMLADRVRTTFVPDVQGPRILEAMQLR